MIAIVESVALILSYIELQTGNFYYGPLTNLSWRYGGP